LARKVRGTETAPRARHNRPGDKHPFGYGDESASVGLEEVAPDRWAAEVYQPDIVEKSATLYVKPGYKM
jgi:hypothetical protein